MITVGFITLVLKIINDENIIPTTEVRNQFTKTRNDELRFRKAKRDE